MNELNKFHPIIIGQKILEDVCNVSFYDICDELIDQMIMDEEGFGINGKRK